MNTLIVILTALLLIAAWYDLRSFRIPNILVLLGLAASILINCIFPEEMGGLGLTSSFAGLIIGFLIIFPLYLLHAMGAGDIKLMAMVGAFVGPVPMIQIALYVAIAGGVLALIVLFSKSMLFKPLNHNKLIPFHSQLSTTAGNLDCISTNKAISRKNIKIPYGVAIAAGTYFYLITNL